MFYSMEQHTQCRHLFPYMYILVVVPSKTPRLVNSANVGLQKTISRKTSVVLYTVFTAKIIVLSLNWHSILDKHD